MSPRSFAIPPTRAAEDTVSRFWMTLGIQIREARLERHWSVSELAHRAGLSRAATYLVEAGQSTSIEAIARLSTAFGLRLEVQLGDPRRQRSRPSLTVDLVHSAMGEVEAGHLRQLGFGIGIDEPYQHFQFAGRADVVAWDLRRSALLHLENKTRFPDLQDLAGSYNAKRAYLGAALAGRLGVRRWRSETHVLVGLWSREASHAFRLRRASFTAICPDPADAFAGWWAGDAATTGSTSSIVFLDPLATGRRRAWIDAVEALTARSRYRGYAEIAASLDRGTG